MDEIEAMRLFGECGLSAIPGLFAFFCGNISLSQVVELIKARHSHDDKSIQLIRTQFRNNKVELRIPRLPHPLHAVQTQQALASGALCENHVRELRTFFTLSQSHASRVLLL